MRPSTNPAKEQLLRETADEVAAFIANGGKLESVPDGITAEKRKTMHELHDATYKNRKAKE